MHDAGAGGLSSLALGVNSPRSYNGADGPRVAIAHDYLTQRGGAERVVLSMSRAFPDAPIYTLLYDPPRTYPEFAERDIRVSRLNSITPFRRHHRVALPVLATAAQSMFIDADVVVISTSGWAHGMQTRGHKLVFCHTPAHWLYMAAEYLGESAPWTERIGLTTMSPYLKRWDRRAALSADVYLANSTLTQRRIERAYGRRADILHSPVADASDTAEPIDDVRRWSQPDGTFYLCVARLLPYKNVDRVIRAFAATDRRLVVVGAGPEEKRLGALASPNVLMLSGLRDAQITWLYRRCQALIAASYEDFGLTPIEAAAQGKPSVTLRWGGYLDTVDELVTGIYFDEPQPAAIAEALDRFETMDFDAGTIRKHAEQFTETRFAAALYDAVDGLAGASSTQREG